MRKTGQKLFVAVALMLFLTALLGFAVDGWWNCAKAGTLTDAQKRGWLWPVTNSSGTPLKGLSRGFYRAGERVGDNNKHYAIDIPGDGNTVRASKAGKVLIVYSGCTNYSALGENGVNCKTRNKCNPNYGYSSESMCNSGFGNGLIIDHEDGTYTQYAHMLNDSITVKKGVHVVQGQILGKTSSAGNSSGPHLHFGIGIGSASSRDWNCDCNPNSASLGITTSYDHPNNGSANKNWKISSDGYVYDPNGVTYVFSADPVTSVVSKTQTTAKIHADFPKVVVTNAGYNIYKGDECVKEYDAHYSGTWNTNYLAWTVWNLNIATAYKVEIWYEAGGKRYTSGKVSFRTASEEFPKVAVYNIQENQVKICTDFEKKVVTNAGYNLYKGSECIKAYDANYSGTWNTNYLAWTIWSLDPGTDYKIQIWFESGGKKYTSGFSEFTTAGSSSAVDIEVPEHVSVHVGEYEDIEWRLLPDGAEETAVTFTSSNPEICDVDDTGRITGLNVGNATITITTENGLSRQVSVEVIPNIFEREVIFNGDPAPVWYNHVEVVPGGRDIPYEFRYTLMNDVDPGYNVTVDHDGYDSTLSWTQNSADHTVRFGGYGMMLLWWEAPNDDTIIWGKVLVTDDAVSFHVPADTTDIGDEAFAGTGAVFFYLPDSVRSIGAHAFPTGSYVFLNTHNIESIAMNGDGINYVETNDAFNADFLDMVNAAGTETYYVPNGVAIPEHWSEWSDWSIYDSEASEDVQVETKLQYRSAPITMGEEPGEWSAWSSWSRTRQSISDPDLMEEATRTLYHYYYFECSGCGAHMPYSTKCLTELGGCGKSSGTVSFSWHQDIWLTTTKAQCTSYNNGAKYWTTSGGKKVYLYTDADTPSMVQYRYRTREYVPVEIIGEYGDWTDDYIEETDSISVEVRTLYRTRYRTFIG